MGHPVDYESVIVILCMLLPSSEYTISISIWTNKEVFDKGTNATNVMRDALGRHDVATVALGNGETQLEETI